MWAFETSGDEVYEDECPLFFYTLSHELRSAEDSDTLSRGSDGFVMVALPETENHTHVVVPTQQISNSASVSEE